jgi:membrane associated rhomboid family serine protease
MSLGSWPPDEAAALLSRLAVGWEPTVVRGGWWTAISSQLVHANVLHLLGNLAVISYCAFRCERAVGSAGLLAFVAASTTGGAAMVCALGDRPCVGSSILGFGLWGAQFALGWRFEEWIPERLRGNYGVGTAFITIPLWIESLTSPSVSFAGHLGGWLGGATAAMLLAPPTATPKAAVAAATRRALLVAAGLFALPMLAVVWGRS